MQLEFTNHDPVTEWVEALTLGYEDQIPAGALVITPVLPGGALAQTDRGWSEAFHALVKDMSWLGKSGPCLVPFEDRLHLILAPVDLPVHPEERARDLGLKAAALVRDFIGRPVAIPESDEVPAAGIFAGLAHGLYSPSYARTKTKESLPPRVFVYGGGGGKSLNQVKLKLASELYCRYLQDLPPNLANPDALCEAAQAIPVPTRVLRRKELSRLGMGALLSVGEGSDYEPGLAILEIEGHDPSRKVALIGKGVTFDAGGLNIKPTPGLEEMKYDMSGAAAVLAAARYFAANKPPVSVVCAIATSENLPSAQATKPGGLVRAYNGKTIEVINTDAEGRLLLADALAYVAREYQPAVMVDIATLTGAVQHALGHIGAAIFSRSDRFAQAVVEGAGQAGERLWQLPLWSELRNELKGQVADYRNLPKTGVMAGTCVGGVFLEEFVPESVTWAHVDIAGTGWSCQATGYPSVGGSGFGVRTLIASVEAAAALV